MGENLASMGMEATRVWIWDEKILLLLQKDHDCYEY